MLVLVSVLLTACSAPSSDTSEEAGADSASGSDTDTSPDTDSGADTAPDSGGDSGSDTSGDSGGDTGTPLPAYGGQFTHGGFTSTIVCGDGSIAEYACSETLYLYPDDVPTIVRGYRVTCFSEGDTSGSGETAAAIGAYFFNPAVGELTGTDILAPGTVYSGARLTMSRYNGTDPAGVSTYTGYPTSLTSIYDVEARISAFDDSSLHLAAEIDFSGTDASGAEWVVRFRVDDTFPDCG